MWQPGLKPRPAQASDALALMVLGLSSLGCQSQPAVGAGSGNRGPWGKSSLRAATAGLKSEPLAWELREGHRQDSCGEWDGQAHCT